HTKNLCWYAKLGTLTGAATGNGFKRHFNQISKRHMRQCRTLHFLKDSGKWACSTSIAKFRSHGCFWPILQGNNKSRWVSATAVATECKDAVPSHCDFTLNPAQGLVKNEFQ